MFLDGSCFFAYFHLFQKLFVFFGMRFDLEYILNQNIFFLVLLVQSVRLNHFSLILFVNFSLVLLPLAKVNLIGEMVSQSMHDVPFDMSPLLLLLGFVMDFNNILVSFLLHPLST